MFNKRFTIPEFMYYQPTDEEYHTYFFFRSIVSGVLIGDDTLNSNALALSFDTFIDGSKIYATMDIYDSEWGDLMFACKYTIAC